MKYSLILLFLVFLSIGATAKTLYVRPAGGVYGRGDGTTHADAFSGFRYGLGRAKVGPGDTVFICGNHYEQLNWTASGAANLPIVVDFACPLDHGAIDTVAAGQPYGVYAANVRYVTFSNMRLLGARRNAIRIDASLRNVSDVKIMNSYIDNRRAYDASRACHAVYISPAGSAYRFFNMDVSNNTVVGAPRACLNGNNDGINFEGGYAGNVISRNTISKAHEGIDATSAGTQISFNVLQNNYFSGIKIHGIIRCPTAIFIYNNIISNNNAWGVIFQDSANSIIANNTISQPNSTYGALAIDRVHSCNQTNNTYSNNILISGYVAGVVRIYDETMAVFESRNNWNGNAIFQSRSGALIYLNKDVANNIFPANFSARWRSSHVRDKNINPALTSALRLPSGSLLSGKGVTF